MFNKLKNKFIENKCFSSVTVRTSILCINTQFSFSVCNLHLQYPYPANRELTNFRFPVKVVNRDLPMKMTLVLGIFCSKSF